MGKQELEKRVAELYRKLNLQHKEQEFIPSQPEAFYQDFGRLELADGRRIADLAQYQWETWHARFQYKRILEVKSQKIGETTKHLMADFQLALLHSSHPASCRGYDQLLIAQSIPHAREHLYTLRKMVINSAKYAKYLITGQTELLLRDEITKVTVMYIKNPDNPNRPSRIIGLGANNPGSIWSWKNVKNIHMSDIVAASTDYAEAFDAAITRLANTNGSLIIETPPFGPEGKIYEIYQQALAAGNDGIDTFKVYKYPASLAVEAGIISQEFLDKEKVRLGPLFPRYYGAEFISGGGNVFKLEDIDEISKLQYLPYSGGENVHSYMGIDPAFGTDPNGSKYAVSVTALIDGIVHVLYSEEYPGKTMEFMAEEINRLIYKFKPVKIYIDAANPAVIKTIKSLVGDRVDFENDSPEELNWRTVQPVPFNSQGREMLANLESLVANKMIRIDPSFSKLLRDMRLATHHEGKLNKESPLTMDSLDSLRLACKGYGVRNI